MVSPILLLFTCVTLAVAAAAFWCGGWVATRRWQKSANSRFADSADQASTAAEGLEDCNPAFLAMLDEELKL